MGEKQVLFVDVVSAVRHYRRAMSSTVLALFADHLKRQCADVAFENYAEATLQELNYRIDGYSRTLDGASALFAAQDGGAALDWKYYVDTLNIEANLPGILGVGFIALIKEIEGVYISSQLLERGILLPPVHPDTGLPERFVVQFIEPLENNRAALGLDMGLSPNGAGLRKLPAKQIQSG